jgi:hypothetical protein
MLFELPKHTLFRNGGSQFKTLRNGGSILQWKFQKKKNLQIRSNLLNTLLYGFDLVKCIASCRDFLIGSTRTKARILGEPEPL